MAEELWRPVVGYEGYYEVSDHGHVRSLDRLVEASDGRTLRIQGRDRKLWRTPDGHLKTSLHKDGESRVPLIHRLVMDAFVGPCPLGMEVCHRNGVGTDNRLSNLRYGTRSENSTDQVRHGVHNQARKTQCDRGHVYTATSTYEYRGRRVCRICRAALKRERRRLKAAV
ncbi:HNH endonuclease [Gordonia phage Malachai]|uniref:NUMOD4 motif-containing HNH endonuclease n=1 Tax=Gordonia sp. ABKF26 TaxID=3238687 RepID=UPI00116343AF|nr:HNH endonuclease [Gordonia phage Begonia]UVF60448.1 HNH endonuclease [Gordonia phage Malachai]